MKDLIQQQEREFEENTTWEKFGRLTSDKQKKLMKSLLLSQKIELLERVIEMVENQPTFTGGSSVNEKDIRINKANLLSTLQETIKEIK